MADYVTWLKSLPAPRAFAANPLAFDGSWFDYYLRRYAAYGLAQGPYETDRIFQGPALCLRSYTAALTGLPPAEVGSADLPPAWLGDVPHTHRAIDDALGFVHLLTHLAGQSGSLPVR